MLASNVTRTTTCVLAYEVQDNGHLTPRFVSSELGHDRIMASPSDTVGVVLVQ